MTFSGLEARLLPGLQTLLHSVIAADDIDDDGVISRTGASVPAKAGERAA